MTNQNMETHIIARNEEAALWCLRLAEGQQDEESLRDLERWLDAHSLNQAAFDDAVQIWQAVDDIRVAPEMLEMRKLAISSLQRAQRKRWSLPITGRATGVIAAGIAVIIGVLALFITHLPTTYQTAKGERQLVVLDDGSKLSLDADTRVEVRLERDKRALTLIKGRARFEVAKDTLRPFSVTAADKVVVATGTAFSVERLRQDIRVVLYEGHVAVLNQTKAGGSRPVVLEGSRSGRGADHALVPGRELFTSVNAVTAQVEDSDPTRTLSWEAGQLIFDDEPLGTAIERVNRYTDSPIELADQATAELRVNGVFMAGDTQAFVEGVTGTLPVELVHRNGDNTLVRLPR
jgi:transmembrane sensor